MLELRLIGDDGTEQSWDGKSMDEVKIRGPWVAASSYNGAAEQWDERLLPTGDVAVIDSEG